MKRICITLVVLSFVSVGPAVHAQELQKRWGSVELGAGPFIPNVDDEFDGGGTTRPPYQAIFGGGSGPMFRLHIGKTLFQSRMLGVVELGFKTGFWYKSGRALDDQNRPTGDRARFSIVPTSLTLTYRAESVWEQLNIPLVPYGRVAVERYNWWTSKEDSWSKSGATNGWSATAGLALVLDWMDPDAAREFENDAGIAHTMVYFDVTKSKVDDFGSDESWDLSEKQSLFWSAGLLVSF